MEHPIVNPDHTAEAQGLEVGDKVCYIKQWVTNIALVMLGEVIEITCSAIVRVKWLDGTERLQFVRHLVKLEGEDALAYLETYKADLDKRAAQQEARNKLRECVEDVAIVERAAERDAGMSKPRKKKAPKPAPTPLKKNSAKARRTAPGSLKSRMLRRRK